MAPPYGAFGCYEYQLARPHMRGALDSWVANPRPPVIPSGVDPHVIPRLAVARDSVAVLLWGRWRPEALLASPEERGDLRHDALMQSIAREHRMIRIEAFASMSPQADWHRAWVIEFPTFDGAEAWLEAEVFAARAVRREALIPPARRWAPEYSRPGRCGRSSRPLGASPTAGSGRSDQEISERKGAPRRFCTAGEV